MQEKGGEEARCSARHLFSPVGGFWLEGQQGVDRPMISSGWAQKITRRWITCMTRWSAIPSTARRIITAKIRHVEAHVELQDQVAEALLGPDELADDGAEHAEHDGDVEPREDERQGIGEGDEPEGLPPARSQRAHQSDFFAGSTVLRPTMTLTSTGKKATSAAMITLTTAQSPPTR